MEYPLNIFMEKYKIVKIKELYFIKKSNGRLVTWKDFDIKTRFPTTPAVYQLESLAKTELKRLLKKSIKKCRESH